MKVPEAHEDQAAVARGELAHRAQQTKERQFRTNVVVSWIVMLLFVVFLFTGESLNLGINLIHLDKDFIKENISFISSGIWVTLDLSFRSILLATLLAFLAALGRLSRVPPIYALSTFYVSLIRGTPLYLQIFFFFLALPQLGIRLSGLSAGVIALGLNYGAYMSEIFRAGISSVGKGQWEAASALGMTPAETMRRVVVPQALRFAVPPTGNEFIAMTKDSALISATGFVHEIMWLATKVGRSQFRNLEALLVAAVFYWIITLALTALQSRLEAWLGRGER